MHTRIISNTLLLVFLVTSLLSCKDDDELTLPPVTITGAGTFGCIVDGKIYVPQGVDSEPLVDASFEMIVVSGGQSDVNLQLIVRDTLHHPILVNQPYYFNQKDVTCIYHLSNKASNCDYRDTPVTGYIKFARIDFEKHIISGVFEFSAYSPKCDKVINVTDGRFDIRTDL